MLEDSFLFSETMHGYIVCNTRYLELLKADTVPTQVFGFLETYKTRVFDTCHARIGVDMCPI